MTLSPLAPLALAAAAALPAAAADPLPAAGFLPEWRLDGPRRVFAGSELFGHIDGGAELFLELGFERLDVQGYAGPAGGLTLELYRMTDAAAAVGVYLTRCGRETPAPGLADRHTVGTLQLQLQRERHYLAITNETGSAALVPAMLALAEAVASRLPPSPPFAAGALLPPAGLVPGSLRVIRGPFGLEALVTLGEGDVLQLGRGATAVGGVYEGEDGSHSTRIVVSYPSEAAAAAALAHLSDHLDRTLEPLERSPQALAFRGRRGEQGEATVRGALLEVVVGPPARPDADPREPATRSPIG